MTLILALSVAFLFFLKAPKVAEANFLRERTDSIMVSTLPHHNETNDRAAGDTRENLNNHDDAIEALLDK